MLKNYEVWKNIDGYVGNYQISSFGNVKSLERQARTKNGSRTVRERFLKKTHDKEGYLNVKLSKNSKIRTFKLHRLVGEYFIENPNNLPQINHIDEDKTNNYYKNLEYTVNLKNTNNYHSKNGTKKYGIHMSQGKWRARIKKDGKSICLGFYIEKEKAYKEFYNKYKELHEVAPW